MTLLKRRLLLQMGLAGGASLLAGSPAMALVKIVVTAGEFIPLPIAIPDFASSDPQFGRDVAEIVRNNLRRSGLFQVIEPATLPTAVGNVGAEPDFASWRAIAADAVVMGQVERGGTIQSAVRIWDTQAAAQVAGKSNQIEAASWRRIGHIVSDTIYAALTGEGGYFDTRIVYVAESGPKANRIKRLAVMDQDGANVQYITSGKALALTPRFSPTQQMLTYMNYDNGEPRVFVLDMSSGRQQSIGAFGQMTFAPRFSPDGRALAFSVEAEGNTNIYSMPVGGDRPVQLTNGAAIDTSPSYAPDGSRIVFESDRGGSQQIYIMGASGGAAQRVSYGQGTYSTPVWSPKGDYIAFTKQANGQFHIGIMKPDGSGERILVSSFHAEGPTWAPNGLVLMYFSDPGGNDGARLYTVDVFGRNNQVLQTETFASDPAWSPLLT